MWSLTSTQDGLDKRKDKRGPRCAVLLFPWASQGPYLIVENLLQIIAPISESVALITGNPTMVSRLSGATVEDLRVKMHYTRDSSFPLLSSIRWIAKSVLFQLKSCISIAMRRKRTDIVFFLAHPYQVLPLMMTRLLGIRSVDLVTRGGERRDGAIPRLAEISGGISFALSTTIALESPSLMSLVAKESHRRKIIGEAARFVDLTRFQNRKHVNERHTVAFIGRLRPEKGALEFALAAPRIVARFGLDVVIAGSGDLEREISSLISAERTTGNRTRIRGWLTSDEVAEALGDTLILVLPSTTEGLPTILIEAMAAGTIVLATDVGAVRDLIVDGKTGFILNGPDAASIEEGIARVLSHENLQAISDAGRQEVARRYSEARARERYKAIIEKTCNRSSRLC